MVSYSCILADICLNMLKLLQLFVGDWELFEPKYKTLRVFLSFCSMINSAGKYMPSITTTPFDLVFPESPTIAGVFVAHFTGFLGSHDSYDSYASCSRHFRCSQGKCGYRWESTLAVCSLNIPHML